MEGRRIAIVGLGAIGSWVAARLALAGHRVAAVVRGGSNATALTLHDGGEPLVATIRRSNDARALGEQDIVVIAVKAPAFAAAAAAAQPLFGAHTLILPMLNGVPWWFLGAETLQSIDPGGAIASLVPLQQTVGCVVHAAIVRDGDGARVQRSDGLLLGEPLGGTSERIERLAELFTAAGIDARPDASIRRAIWYKLWGNMTINPVSALTLATADRIIASAARPFLLACMAEAAAVGARIGCRIEETGEDRMAVTARLGAFRTSMLQDVEAGRPIELEALLGAPREIGRHVGVSTPGMDALYGLTRLFAESRGLL